MPASFSARIWRCNSFLSSYRSDSLLWKWIDFSGMFDEIEKESSSQTGFDQIRDKRSNVAYHLSAHRDPEEYAEKLKNNSNKVIRSHRKIDETGFLVKIMICFKFWKHIPINIDRLHLMIVDEHWAEVEGDWKREFMKLVLLWRRA